MFFLFQETPNDKKGEIDVNPTSIIEKLDSWVDGFVKALPNILVGIAFFLIMLFIARWAGKFIKKQLTKRNRANFGEILGGFTKWALIIVGLVFGLTIVSPNLSPADLIAGLGVSSVAIGFAFKDILQNWLAGILILTRRPFEIGDQIVIHDYEGYVEEVRTRSTQIRTYDGQVVVMPNNEIYNNAVKVITANELIRSQYDIGLGYDQPRDKAMKILRETIEGIEGVSKDKPVDILPWDQADDWLTIRVRWWTDSDRPNVVNTFSKVILETQNAMDNAGIDLPFPTQVRIINAHDHAEAKQLRDQKEKANSDKKNNNEEEK